MKNLRYTGRQVWNRQRRDEVLVDIENVAAGYESKLRWNDASEWVWSTDESHEAIVSPESFEAVQRQMSAGSRRPHSPKRHTTSRTYVLSGLLHSAVCGHRMQGGVHHGHQNYRCRFPRDFAPPLGMEHPGVIYVREDAIVPKLDEWIGSLFDPENIEQTCETLALAAGASGADQARIQAAERKLADCDKRLDQYRKALDSGADASLVAGWMAEVQGERLRTGQDLLAARPSDKLTKKQMLAIVAGLGDVAKALCDTDPKIKSRLYEELCISVIYDHTTRTVTAGAKVSVGGGT